MSSRTLTSKGLRLRVRRLNKANEGLAVDLKAARTELTVRADTINTLEGKLADHEAVKQTVEATSE